MSGLQQTYAGDIGVDEAWRTLAEDPRSVLVDVRTSAEWSFVGVADLKPIAKEPVLLEWQVYPSMAQNPDFGAQLAAELTRRGTPSDTPVLFLCRSGVRSRSAAIVATALGWTAAYNVAGGFEGPIGPDGHRGATGGWKAAGLPWVQS